MHNFNVIIERQQVSLNPFVLTANLNKGNRMSDTAKKERFLTYLFICLLIFSAILKVSISMGFVNWFDTSWYMGWAQSLQNGFFNCYDHISDLDYPPLYLYPLYIIGMILKIPAVNAYAPLTMLTMKALPVLFDLLGAAVVFWLFKKKTGIELSFVMGVLYAFNPAITFNSSFWGQTDSILLLFFIVILYSFETGRPILGTVLFAAAALTKNQALLFSPVIIMELVSKYPVRKIIRAFAAGLLTALLGFAPFIIESSMGFRLPFKVYFGSFGEYNYIDLNAFNLYGIFNLNWVNDDTGGFFNLHLVSMVLTLICFAGVVYCFFKSRVKSISVISFLYMQLIYMFTTRMHERYQIIVIALLTVAVFFLKDFRLLLINTALSVVVFVNQAALLSENFAPEYFKNWAEIFNHIQTAFSIINLALFVYSFYVCSQILFKGKIHKIPFGNTESDKLTEKSEAVSSE